MQIVIDIPEKEYLRLKEPTALYWDSILYKAIANGIPYEERKKGKWIWREDEKYYDTPTGNATYECSLCHHSDVHAKTQEVPYCWWCGAKMEVGE